MRQQLSQPPHNRAATHQINSNEQLNNQQNTAPADGIHEGGVPLNKKIRNEVNPRSLFNFRGSLQKRSYFMRYSSTSAATSRPSRRPQTTSDCPLLISPAANTPSTEVACVEPVSTFDLAFVSTPNASTTYF